jgi:AGCS family alanine or glycine:cation symporter
LGHYRIPTVISGGLVALFIMVTLMGGIKRVGSFSSKLVPLMFVLYVGTTFYILIFNFDQWGRIFHEMIASALSPVSMASGVFVGGIMSTLRWGIFKGTQTSEAGIGTQAIPHSMSETKDPVAQGTLSMLSTYTAGFVAFLSGCVCLVTETWKDPELPLGMSMVAASFQQYFSYFGIGIVVVSSLLFGFGTILGNSYNGSQCYGYLTKNRKMSIYLYVTAIMIYIGSIAGVKTMWSMIDIVLACMAVPHIAALVTYAYKKKSEVEAHTLWSNT